MSASPGAPDSEAVRCFFALWPPAGAMEALGRQAASLARELGGRRTRNESIHLTLAFLGDVSPAALARLSEVPPDIPVAPFELVVDRLGAWNHNGIGWAAPSAIPGPLIRLERRLSRWLAQEGFELDARTFRPHVTLVRRATGRKAECGFEPVHWPVTEFVLVRSDRDAAGSVYRIVSRTALPPANTENDT